MREVASRTMSAGGIALPETATSRQPGLNQQAEVIAVGPGKYFENGQQETMPVVPGDRVLYLGNGYPLEEGIRADMGVELLEGENLLLVQKHDLICKINAPAAV